MNNIILELYKYQTESERKRIKERKRQDTSQLLNLRTAIMVASPNSIRTVSNCKHAFKLYQSGMTDIAVSKVTGINRITFKRYREKLGITQIS